MKPVRVAVVILLLLAAGCQYEAPLDPSADVPIDRSVLGVWSQLDKTGQPSENQMLILPYSGTEYLIHHPVGEKGLYYRAYAIKIGTRKCVQMEVVGTRKGALEEGQMTRFHVAMYTIADGNLKIDLLNSERVSKDQKTTHALREAFLMHVDDPDLFLPSLTFRRAANP